MTKYTASDAKREFGDVLLNAQKGPVSITRNAKPVAVILSAADYEALVAGAGTSAPSPSSSQQDTPARPTSQELEQAADAIDREARFLGLWDGAPRFEDLDPVARAEYSGLVERILKAAAKARV